MSIIDIEPALYPHRAVDRVCDLLDLLASAPHPVTLTNAADGARLPKSSAFRYLTALEARGFVTRHPDTGRYELAFAAGGAPAHRRDQLGSVIASLNRVRPELRTTAAEVTVLAVLEGSGIRYVWVDVLAIRPPWLPETGQRDLVHATAVGKAIAAQMSDRAVVELLDRTGMLPSTPQTLTSPTAFLRELGRVRGEGYAIDDAEHTTGIRCVAVPVIGGEFIAGLGIVAPLDRMPPDRVTALARQLRRVAVGLARDLRG